MSELGPNFKLGDQDRIVNSFNKNGEFKYAMVLVRDSYEQQNINKEMN